MLLTIDLRLLPMNTTLKIIAFLAILPLFTAALTQSYFTDVNAEKSAGDKAPGRASVQSYGSANKGIVCGDKLCSAAPVPTVPKTVKPSEPAPKKLC